MLEKIFNNKSFSILAKVFIVIGFILLAAVISLGIFTFCYWLITLILLEFFAFILPFSFNFAFGAWLIWLIIIGLFSIPSAKINIKY